MLFGELTQSSYSKRKIAILKIAFDGFFILVSMHCAARLSVCRYYASKIGKHRQVNVDDAIENLVVKHLKTLELIETTNSIYELVNLTQLFTALAIFVILSVQMTIGASNSIFLFMFAALLQLLFYCALGELISSSV